jgi:hypothetical protein
MLDSSPAASGVTHTSRVVYLLLALVLSAFFAGTACGALPQPGRLQAVTPTEEGPLGDLVKTLATVWHRRPCSRSPTSLQLSLR